MTITIEVVSDVICPWCYLGKRRLDKAIAMLEGVETEIRWRPFLLDATIPDTGIPRREYLLKKFGSAERIAELHKPLRAAGDAEGIAYAFDKIEVTPNTLNAHRLVRWAHGPGKQHEMAEKLFALYWLEGENIGDSDVLLKAAVDVGLDGPLVSQLLGSEADLDPVIAEINQAVELGITGVPTFIVANRYAVVGAQAPEALRSGIMRAALELRRGTEAKIPPVN
jgi:predicted DsbA family dithiol-disulfide isomerase